MNTLAYILIVTAADGDVLVVYCMQPLVASVVKLDLKVQGNIGLKPFAGIWSPSLSPFPLALFFGGTKSPTVRFPLSTFSDVLLQVTAFS